MKVEQLAVSVILKKDGRYLLVERAREPGKGLFAFPGGRVEPGEKLEAAARRELREETGMSAGTLTLAAEYHLATKSGSFHLHVFSAETFEGTPIASDDAASVGWYAPIEMKALPMPQSMHDMLSKLMRD